MNRLTELNLTNLTPRQQQVYESIRVSRKGSVDGPFAPWLLSPELADRAQKLGAYCRYDTSLTARLSELAILLTAHWWQAEVEWQLHVPEARSAGVSSAIIASLRSGQRPDYQQEDDAAVHDFASELLANRRVSDATYQRLVGQVGEVGVVELVGILGYYSLVAMTLNVFEVKLQSEDGSSREE